MNFSDKNIRKVVSVLKGFYLFIMVILIILTSFLYLYGGRFRMEALIGIVFTGVVYIGLKNKQPWVISVIVYSASLGLISQLINSPNNTIKLAAKILGSALTIFEIYFFTRKEVKKYFGVKSIFLFGR